MARRRVLSPRPTSVKRGLGIRFDERRCRVPARLGPSPYLAHQWRVPARHRCFSPPAKISTRAIKSPVAAYFAQPMLRGRHKAPRSTTRDPMVTARQLCFVDDPAVVASARQNKSHIAVSEQLGFVDGLPRRDVDGFCAHSEYRSRDVLERDHTSVDGKPACRQPVFTKQAAQIL